MRFRNFLKPAKTVKVEKPRNVEAEKLALRLIKSRQKYKTLKKLAILQAQQDNSTIQQLKHGLLCCLAKSNGVVILQKELMDSVAENMHTMELAAKVIKGTPGDIEFKILDTSKKVEDEAGKDEK